MDATLDHVGLVVPDLADAARDFEALGFTLTDEADHTRTDGAPAGSVQRSIMMETGYIELQQLTGPAGSHLLSAAQDKFHGLHILAFGVADAGAAREAVATAGLAVGDVLEWSRTVERPEGAREARFSFFVADYRVSDEALLCWVRHRTPELIREPGALAHANGAVALGGLTFAAADSGLAETIRTRMLTAGAVPDDDALRLGSARLLIETATGPDDAGSWPAPAHVRDMHLAFTDPSAILERADVAGWPVALGRDGGTIDMRTRYNVRLIARTEAAE